MLSLCARESSALSIAARKLTPEATPVLVDEVLENLPSLERLRDELGTDRQLSSDHGNENIVWQSSLESSQSLFPGQSKKLSFAALEKDTVCYVDAFVHCYSSFSNLLSLSNQPSFSLSMYIFDKVSFDGQDEQKLNGRRSHVRISVSMY